MKSISAQFYMFVAFVFFNPALSWSQIDFDTTIPSPSAMSTYQDVPVNYCTGIPDIRYELLSLPTSSKDFGFNLSLNYHPNNTTVNSKVSDVGRGWSWFGIPSISKNVMDPLGLDENKWFQNITEEHAPHAFADVYYYNINGESGKFKFSYDYNSGTVKMVMLTPTQMKFTFQHENQGKLLINSFSVTDTYGLVYNFNLYDITKIGSGPLGKPVRNNFHLTSVYDSHNVQLCSLTYSEVYQETGSFGKIVSVQKVNQINANNVGKINFSYDTQPLFINSNYDISKLEAITLFSLTNEQNKKCTFNYTPDRKLANLNLIGTNSSVVEKYQFEYKLLTGVQYDGNFIQGTDLEKKTDRFGFPFVINKCSIVDLALPQIRSYTNKNSVDEGLLEKVILPTGGVIKYEFEANEIDLYGYQNLGINHFSTIDIDDNFNESLLANQNLESFAMKNSGQSLWGNNVFQHSEDYFLENLGSSNYTVGPIDTGRLFQMTQDTELFIRFEIAPNSTPLVPDSELNMGFEIRNGATVLGSFIVSKSSTACVNLSPMINLLQGWYTIYITSVNGGSVNYTMYARRKKANPISYIYSGGVRVKSIQYFENRFMTTSLKTTNFDYRDFNNSSRSSGSLYGNSIGRGYDVYSGYNSFVLYKNVKVSDGINNGYTKFSFYVIDDFVNSSLSNLTFDYYKIVKDGLLYKKELFNNQNQLIEKSKYYYDIKIDNSVISEPRDWLMGYYGVVNPIVKNYFIKRKYIKIEKFLSGTQPTVLKSVEIANDWNLKPESITAFDSQNKKHKTRYYYINEITSTPYYSGLITKNIISSPLVVEQYYDGNLVSKTKSEFDLFGGNLYKKAKSYTSKGSNPYTLEQRISGMELSANKIKEVTNDKGSYTSYIWGYNMTQPVAKIENMQYASIPSGLISAIQSATNIANNEVNILAALENFRNDPALANAMVTTYTYKPLVGISTVTDPKGDKVTYHYDTFNRLLSIKDKNGNLLSENQYNFRP